MIARLRELYEKDLKGQLMKELSLNNINQVPRLEKIVLNMGLGLDGNDSKIVKLCNDNSVPIVPFGTGTSLEGHVLGNEKGITLSLENMSNILDINSEDFDCRVEAFVTRKQLNEELKNKGLFFPIDPGANASLGGMTATSASGTMAVKYGTMKTIVMGLTVVLPNGDIIKTGTRTKKTSAGYNLTNLFIGSEGTLGIITEVHLRLSPIPESIMSAVCQFPDLESAVLTAQEIIQYGVAIARVEMLNEDQMEISIKYSKLDNLEAKPTLFYEFHGSQSSNQEDVSIVEELSKNITTIIIAHRLSTVVNSDIILVLNKGEIVEKGNHKSLLELNGLYASMWKHQEKNLK